MRDRYERKLKTLNNELIELGGLVEKSIRCATDALVEKDLEKADEVNANEIEINAKEKEIENLCFELLLHQQPVAKDLRLVSSALKMITDMERIGDYAQDIAELAAYLSQYEHIHKLKHINKMSEICSRMTTQCINAFVDKDVIIAANVIVSDDMVDEEFTQMKDELIEIIRENRDNCEQAIDLIMITKYLERIGDHAVNIAEWVIYSITGKKEYSVE